MYIIIKLLHHNNIIVQEVSYSALFCHTGLSGILQKYGHTTVHNHDNGWS